MKQSVQNRCRVMRRQMLFPIVPAGRRTRLGDQALLILDERGCIQFCGDARLLGHEEDSLTGSPINMVIPSLSLRERAPGQNLAYVNFWFAGDIWRRHEARSHGGQSLTVDITLRSTITNDQHWFVGLIRHQQPSSQDHQPRRTPFSIVSRESPYSRQTPRVHQGPGRQIHPTPPAA